MKRFFDTVFAVCVLVSMVIGWFEDGHRGHRSAGNPAAPLASSVPPSAPSVFSLPAADSTPRHLGTSTPSAERVITLPAVRSLSISCYGGAARLECSDGRAWELAGDDPAAGHSPWFVGGPLPASTLVIEQGAGRHVIVEYEIAEGDQAGQRRKLYFGPCDVNNDGLLNSQDFFDFTRDFEVYQGR